MRRKNLRLIPWVKRWLVRKVKRRDLERKAEDTLLSQTSDIEDADLIQQRRLKAALATLTPLQLQTVIALYQEGLTQKELAAKEEVGQTRIERRVQKIKEKLRGFLSGSSPR